jgi:membrane-associated phospholipid phosphatase
MHAGTTPAHSNSHFTSGWTVAKLLGFATVLLIVDALVRDRGGWDYRLINIVREVQFPGDEGLMKGVSGITGTQGAVAAWFILFTIFLLSKRWLDTLALAIIPTAAIVSSGIQALVDRPRPDLSRIHGLEGTVRVVEDLDYASFPSGHVIGAVLLYGFLFYLAGGVSWRPARVALSTAFVAIILLTGISRVWLGSHWVSDVIAGYTLGLAMLAVMLVLYRKSAPHLVGAPLISARPQPHDEAVRHAHALTSLILFREGEAWKIYSPGFVPQAVYWLSFQAPFPYANNEAALAAALHRRKLARLLSEYWYGEPRVGELLRIDDYDGRPAVVSRFIEGKEPDHDSARPFLEDLAARFDQAGLPTWQIDPRQPRSFGNVIETPDGRLMIIDLESGMVSPLASPRAWMRAIRRATVPLFDDMYFDVTRDYVTAEEDAMRAQMGDDWYWTVRREVDRAEQTAIAWHSSEPRIWSRILRWLFTGFYFRTWRRRAEQRAAMAEATATHFIEDSVERWEQEGRISREEAEEITEAVESDDFQAVLPHFGVHLMIGVALRFPIGSIARVLYTGGNLLLATILLLLRRRSRAQWKRSLSIHSPLVIVIAAMPGIGTFSYMASKPMREQAKVARLVLDAGGEKLPWRLYERLGLRRIVTARSRSTQPAK